MNSTTSTHDTPAPGVSASQGAEKQGAGSGDAVLVRYELSAAYPSEGPMGGLRHVASEDHQVATADLPAHARGLAEWTSAALAERRCPLGLYVAECGVVGEDTDETGDLGADWLSEHSIAWAETEPWRTGLLLHPRLPRS